ncbi:Mitochondrial chaperone Frataxin [Pestalotiopsis sp. 9143b]|nr:Mitochondrial chaperone Frataxin [Pestalotiopsis sp. 9143b]
MTRSNIAKLGRAVGRGLQVRAATAVRPTYAQQLIQRKTGDVRIASAAFSSSSVLFRPLSAEALKTAQPASITDEQYHKLADQYLDDLLVTFEEEQDAKDEIDVEYSAGVMNIKYPHGTYVINKQPPNKQIWLSSPLSGPKRYDYVVTSEGQESKQDTATGGWVYLRDGSSLSELLQEETGINLEGLGGDAVESL